MTFLPSLPKSGLRHPPQSLDNCASAELESIYLLLLFNFRLPLYCDYQRSISTTVTMFTQPDTLPYAQSQFAIGNGNGYRHSKQTALHMGRHVV